MDSKDPLNVHQIMNILPHRYPFLLVDQVLYRRRPDNLEDGDWKGAKLLALKNVTINEPYFAGHFPHAPIMPGVMVLEAMAQAAVLLVERPHPNGEKWNFVLSGIRDARFRKPIVPGDCLHLHVELKKIKVNHTVYLFACQALVGDIKKAEAHILAHIT